MNVYFFCTKTSHSFYCIFVVCVLVSLIIEGTNSRVQANTRNALKNKFHESTERIRHISFIHGINDTICNYLSLNNYVSGSEAHEIDSNTNFWIKHLSLN